MAASASSDGPYFCDKCQKAGDEESADVTEIVRRERDEQIVAMRAKKRSGKPWTVIVRCANDHEVLVEGVFP